jgi:hypothetical protein
LLLDGLSCVEVADESASCSLSASWPAAWTPPPPLPPPPCSWSASCSVALAFPAAEAAPEWLLWSTAPPSPPLLIRTAMLLLDGLFCVEVADESASCSLSASWPAAWTPPPPLPPPPWL